MLTTTYRVKANLGQIKQIILKTRKMSMNHSQKRVFRSMPLLTQTASILYNPSSLLRFLPLLLCWEDWDLARIQPSISNNNKLYQMNSLPQHVSSVSKMLGLVDRDLNTSPPQAKLYFIKYRLTINYIKVVC